MKAKIAGMAGPHQDSMTVVLDSAHPPITGQVRSAGQPERPFVGWLELLTALDGAIGDLQAVNDHADQRNWDQGGSYAKVRAHAGR